MKLAIKIEKNVGIPEKGANWKTLFAGLGDGDSYTVKTVKERQLHTLRLKELGWVPVTRKEGSGYRIWVFSKQLTIDRQAASKLVLPDHEKYSQVRIRGTTDENGELWLVECYNTELDLWVCTNKYKTEAEAEETRKTLRISYNLQ